MSLIDGTKGGKMKTMPNLVSPHLQLVDRNEGGVSLDLYEKEEEED